LATAQRFVDEGSSVIITGRRGGELDAAVSLTSFTTGAAVPVDGGYNRI
jgi:short-subunit dehydrogenase involved in D-alanine esterification of teichoic acids